MYDVCIMLVGCMIASVPVMYNVIQHILFKILSNICVYVISNSIGIQIAKLHTKRIGIRINKSYK
jgi:hypothetical protein